MFYKWNVIGHQPALEELEGDIINKTLSHAYLFVGPAKIGKFRVARAIAQIMQCPNSFCRTCPTCIQIEKNSHTDTIILEDDGESIKIATVRDLIGRLSMTSQSAYSVVLIEDIGRFTEESANALLKSLEEPSPRRLFIFTAENSKDVLPTIVSRMRTVHFQKIPEDVLTEELKKQYPQHEERLINQAVALSLGRSGQAISLLTNPEKFTEFKELFDRIVFLYEKASYATRITAVEEIAKDPAQMRLFMTLFTSFLRGKLLDTTTPPQVQARIVKGLEEAHRVLERQSQNVNPRLLLENFMLNV